MLITLTNFQQKEINHILLGYELFVDKLLCLWIFSLVYFNIVEKQFKLIYSLICEN